MLWAAFTLAFFGFLRSSEFTCNGKFDPRTHLSRSDFIFNPNIFNPNFLEITIKKSKTDSFRERAKLTIARSNSNVCVVTALQDCLLQTYGQSTSQPLFKFTDGRNLTRASLTNNLRTLLHILWPGQCKFRFTQLLYWHSHNSGSSWTSWLVYQSPQKVEI